jgi:ubiquinone/menaquinone biosynthesis C-methylase UbiE
MTTQVSKGYKGMGMEGVIATWYAGITKKNMPDFRKDAKTIAANISYGADVLEVAPGPGYLMIELAKLGRYTLTGLDISKKFVEIAQNSAREAGASIDFRHGNAAAMPFADGAFDFIVCRAAFKNFDQPVQALNEMRRVLKPGGKALIIDLRGDASNEAIDQEVEKMGLSALNTWITKFVFKTSLIKRAYKRADFEAMAAQSTFGRARVVEDALGVEVWLEK